MQIYNLHEPKTTLFSWKNIVRNFDHRISASLSLWTKNAKDDQS